MTAKPAVLRPAAVIDVEDATAYYAQEGGTALATRWVGALEAAFRHISLHPATGSTRYAAVLDLPGLRFSAVTRFPYLIFYLECDDHLDVWRVLQAQKNIPAWLAEQDKIA
ncbi:type II toxin-antitoxin system RelE/ParE family toxin [Ramlibacter sp. WS9]|uniref:type II toxin-antitoxin system RelE/ParE family toxin n=1 Tax=Ramlibacter sp. WS9 TaxID=1882741 RepID=UPI001141D623|nr:type II toxin-antitoxin system RelE/ParE family toxin [Ramlibacter sp. WS9]ROZ63415.1 type II toxin-antitoxin system RelE/ParE family toxin [Ramlibacter sp. WS9]